MLCRFAPLSLMIDSSNPKCISNCDEQNQPQFSRHSFVGGNFNPLCEVITCDQNELMTIGGNRINWFNKINAPK